MNLPERAAVSTRSEPLIKLPARLVRSGLRADLGEARLSAFAKVGRDRERVGLERSAKRNLQLP